MCDHIPFCITAHINRRIPVILRMHKHRIILRFVEIKHRLQHIVFHFHKLHRFACRFFILCCNDCDNISHKPHVPVDNQPVIRRWFRISLTCDCKPRLRHIRPCIDIHHARNFLCNFCMDFFHNRIGMRTAQKLHDKRRARDIICIHRFSQQQLHGVFLPD